MAEDNNKTPLQSQQDVEKLVDSGMLTPQTAQMFPFQSQTEESVEDVNAPSTPENQLQTEAAREAADANNFLDTGAAQDEITRPTIIPTPGRTTYREIQPQIKPSELPSDEELLAASEALKESAASHEPVVDAAEDIIQENALQQQKAEEIKDAIDIKNEADENKEAIKQQIAKNEALAAVSVEQAEEQQKEIDNIQAELEQERKELENLSMSALFEDEKAPISKITAGIAIMLGAVGSGLTGGPNLGLQAVNKTMDDFFDRKKYTIKTRLAKKNRILDLIKLDLNKQQQQTNNELKRAQIDRINANIKAEQQQIKQQQYLQKEKERITKKLTGKEGLSREEVFNLDPNLQERAVFFSDGRARFAPSAQSAKQLRQEILPAAKNGIRDIKGLKEIADDFAGGALSLEDRAAAKVKVQSLIGGLRLELFGPGVLTDFEQDLARQIIGNPTKIFTLTNLERKKLDVLEKKLVAGTKSRLEANGITLPETRNEKMLKQFLKNNKNLKREEAISTLILEGYWDHEEMPF